MLQRTKQWETDRLVRITASKFGDVLAKPTTKRYRKYMDDRLYNIFGVGEIIDEPPWFEHGKALEDKARARYEFEYDIDVEQVGLIVHPEYNFIACSPDGLVNNIATAVVRRGQNVGIKNVKPGETIQVNHPNDIRWIRNDGGIEIKCRKSIKEYIKSTGLDSMYKPQVQGSLWITGRQWWDFVNYYQDPYDETKTLFKTHRVYPDLEYHKRIEEACLNFWNELKNFIEGMQCQ